MKFLVAVILLAVCLVASHGATTSSPKLLNAASNTVSSVLNKAEQGIQDAIKKMKEVVTNYNADIGADISKLLDDAKVTETQMTNSGIKAIDRIKELQDKFAKALSSIQPDLDKVSQDVRNEISGIYYVTVLNSLWSALEKFQLNPDLANVVVNAVSPVVSNAEEKVKGAITKLKEFAISGDAALGSDISKIFDDAKILETQLANTAIKDIDRLKELQNKFIEAYSKIQNNQLSRLDETTRNGITGIFADTVGNLEVTIQTLKLKSLSAN